MANEEREARESRAAEPELITDPQEKAEAEAANGLRQYDYAVKSVYEALERQPFKLQSLTDLLVSTRGATRHQPVCGVSTASRHRDQG